VTRTVQVDADRLARWTVGFGTNHGALSADAGPQRLLLRAEDGATATLTVPFEPWAPPPAALVDSLVDSLAAHTRRDRRLGVLLARRGGYAVAVADGPAIGPSKVGTRYVQGRTAAGGWSQQRFARRRDNQTTELVGAATEQALRLLVPARPLDGLVTGGDAGLVERVLADPRLRPLGGLPRWAHLAVGDPRADVLREVPALVRRVRIDLTDPR
jgi:VLRF1 release factor-like protein